MILYIWILTDVSHLNWHCLSILFIAAGILLIEFLLFHNIRFRNSKGLAFINEQLLESLRACYWKFFCKFTFVNNSGQSFLLYLWSLLVVCHLLFQLQLLDTCNFLLLVELRIKAHLLAKVAAGLVVLISNYLIVIRVGKTE